MITALTFDCYGTLIDWEKGFRDAAVAILKERTAALPLDALWKAWEEIQFEKCQGPYKPYRLIASESFEEGLARVGIPREKGDGEKLALRMATWKPFPDVSPSLQALKGKILLFVISNTDDEFLNVSILNIGITFNGSMTGTRAKCYKPNPVIFQRAIEVLKIEPKTTLHVAFGERYDLQPARELGFKTAWLRRKDLSPAPSFQPDFVLQGLEELPKILATFLKGLR